MERGGGPATVKDCRSVTRGRRGFNNSVKCIIHPCGGGREGLDAKSENAMARRASIPCGRGSGWRAAWMVRLVWHHYGVQMMMTMLLMGGDETR